MAEFDQFANQGGPAHTPEEAAEARRLADEQLKNADYAGELPEPLTVAGDAEHQGTPDRNHD